MHSPPLLVGPHHRLKNKKLGTPGVSGGVAHGKWVSKTIRNNQQEQNYKMENENEKRNDPENVEESLAKNTCHEHAEEYENPPCDECIRYRTAGIQIKKKEWQKEAFREGQKEAEERMIGTVEEFMELMEKRRVTK